MPLRGPCRPLYDHAFRQDPTAQVPPNQLQHPFVSDHFCDPAHQDVVIDPVEGTHDTLPTSRSPTKRRSASYEFAILSKANA